MKYPKTGQIRVVLEKEVHVMTSQGWSLLEILTDSQILFGAEQQLHVSPATPTSQQYNVPLASLARPFIGKIHKFVLHLETGSLAEQLSQRATALEAKSQECDVLAAKYNELGQARASIGEALSIQASRNDALTLENAELVKKAATLSAHVTPLLEDLSRCFKALGKDRVREIVGREIEDPYPTPEDQIKNTYQRLLENEDENNQTG